MDERATCDISNSPETGFHAGETEEAGDFAPLPKKQCTESRSGEENDQILQEESIFNDSCTGDSAEALFCLCPAAHELPLSPSPAIEANYVQYYVIDFLKPEHDQYIYRHANGLCVIGLASTHVALKNKSDVNAVDFNVGKSSRSDIKVTGKRKKASREGYIAIMMPKAEDWLKSKDYLLSQKEYKDQRCMS